MASSGDFVKPGDGAIPPPRPREPPVELIGTARAFREALAPIPRIAESNAPVLITGETGTGKEVVARAIHQRGPRKDWPFVVVDCGALPENLLESELFGHRHGAFSGAVYDRVGLFEEAEGGTIFLDEITSTTAEIQKRLLRVLQEGAIRRVGENLYRKVDVRVIAATNAAIALLVTEGAFRRDLFYRLAVFTLHLPPLRQRRDDILPLARSSVAKYRALDQPTPQLTPEAERALLSYSWPGNVRELENAIRRGVTFAQGGEIKVRDLELPDLDDSSAVPPDALSFNEWKRRLVQKDEREHLIALMRENRGNVTRAARSAGKDRRVLGRLLKKHRIDPKDFNGVS